MNHFNMKNINYKQITFAREYRKLSQSELSSKIKGLSQSNLSKFEKGMGFLSDEVLERIIKYLNFPEDFFKQSICNTVENAHYRRKASVLKSERTYIDLSNKLIGYLIDQMSDSLVFPAFNFKFIDLEEGYTPVLAAQYIRRFLKLDDRPVSDIISLLEKNGIFIVEIDEDVDVFDGVSFLTDNGIPVIIINKNFSNDHKRYTIAHELGHIIMHSSREFIFSEKRDKEKEANEFAGEFLMPAEIIKNSLRYLRLSSLLELKRYWLTSMASIVKRAKNLGMIGDEKYKYFNIELSRKGYKKEEPLNVYIDKPTLFKEAYKIHRQDLQYSDEELAQSFKLPLDIIKRFFVFDDRIISLKLNY